MRLTAVALYLQIPGFVLVSRGVGDDWISVLGLFLLISSFSVISFQVFNIYRDNYTDLQYDLEDYEFLVAESDCELKILDRTGSRVLYRKTKVITALKDGERSYTERGIWSDGSMGEVRVSEGVRWEEKTESSVNRSAKEGQIIFDVPLKKGESRRFTVSWEFINSFRENIEHFTTQFTLPPKKYHLRVLFPEDRLPKDAWVDFTYRDRKIPIDERYFKLSVSGSTIDLTVHYAPPGMKSILTWLW